MKHISNPRLFSIVLLALLVAGCKSGSYVQKKQNTVVAGKLEPEHKYLSASVTPSNIKLDMAWSDLIVFRAVPLGLAEVFRVELSHDGVVLVNRLARWYMKIDYSDIPYNGTLKLDFNTIQGLLWNKVFSPGVQASALKVKRAGIEGNTYKEPRAGYAFSFQDRQLISVKRSIASRTGTLDYSEFSYIEGEWIPTRYSVSLKTGKGDERNVGSANLSNIKLSDKGSIDRLNLSQYKKRDFNMQDLKKMRNADISELIDFFR